MSFYLSGSTYGASFANHGVFTLAFGQYDAVCKTVLDSMIFGHVCPKIQGARIGKGVLFFYILARANYVPCHCKNKVFVYQTSLFRFFFLFSADIKIDVHVIRIFVFYLTTKITLVRFFLQ